MKKNHSTCPDLHIPCSSRNYHNVCVSRGSASHKECGARECHVDRAGCSAYSISMRTMCDVAWSLRDNSCNSAEWLIATSATSRILLSLARTRLVSTYRARHPALINSVTTRWVCPAHTGGAARALGLDSVASTVCAGWCSLAQLSVAWCSFVVHEHAQFGQSHKTVLKMFAPLVYFVQPSRKVWITGHVKLINECRSSSNWHILCSAHPFAQSRQWGWILKKLESLG